MGVDTVAVAMMTDSDVCQPLCSCLSGVSNEKQPNASTENRASMISNEFQETLAKDSWGLVFLCAMVDIIETAFDKAQAKSVAIRWLRKASDKI